MTVLDLPLGRPFSDEDSGRLRTFCLRATCGPHLQFFVIDTTEQAAVAGVHCKPGGALLFLKLPTSESCTNSRPRGITELQSLFRRGPQPDSQTAEQLPKLPKGISHHRVQLCRRNKEFRGLPLSLFGNVSRGSL